MRKLMITRSSYACLQRETEKSETETGGLLNGTLRIPIVLQISGAGPLAQMSGASYTNDRMYDRRILQAAIIRNSGRVKLVGYWHKHPGSLTVPSLTDRATARKLIMRNELSDQAPIFFVIANVIRRKLALHAYGMAPKDNDFENVSIQIIDDDAKEIKRALAVEPVITFTKTANFWDDAGFQFYLTRAGENRIRQEIDDLIRYGYEVKANAGEGLSLILKKQHEFLCLLPPEYPLNPPLLVKNGQRIDYCLANWNSCYRIIDLLKIIEKQRGGHNASHDSRPRRMFHKLTGKIGKALGSLRFRKKT